MNRTTLTWLLAASALTSTAAFFAGRALATGTPTQTPLIYGGTVTDDAGKPVATPTDVALKFHDKADGGTVKCSTAAVKTDAGTGRFSVVLPAECVQAVHAAPDLWVEATVGGKGMPKAHVGAVPYALEADVATVAESAKVAVGAGGGLKGQLDGLVKDLGALKAQVDGMGAGGGKAPKMTTLLLPNGSNPTVSLTTSGGTVLLVLSALCITSTNNTVQAVALKVDGAGAGHVATSNYSNSSALAAGAVAAPKLAAGVHVVSFAPMFAGQEIAGKLFMEGATVVAIEF